MGNGIGEALMASWGRARSERIPGKSGNVRELQPHPAASGPEGVASYCGQFGCNSCNASRGQTDPEGVARVPDRGVRAAGFRAEFTPSSAGGGASIRASIRA
ncbi:hypothetical protein Sfum_3443 [Syntrophobacter fumaroxidans MPOB]|uniref:Uncharacterized protein n=1 Tax=Syntrophobacter fumaroxidans (strain DSM 10017 / MPOB) TaxID=335543 RepID=A0LNW2_SYNFM|nr:hypothetical protein Sfum_3443 [Syntrophobacter fumaroxidans MPOB]